MAGSVQTWVYDQAKWVTWAVGIEISWLLIENSSLNTNLLSTHSSSSIISLPTKTIKGKANVCPSFDNCLFNINCIHSIHLLNEMDYSLICSDRSMNPFSTRATLSIAKHMDHRNNTCRVVHKPWVFSCPVRIESAVGDVWILCWQNGWAWKVSEQQIIL